MRNYLIWLVLIGILTDSLLAEKHRALHRVTSKVQKYKRVALVIGNNKYQVAPLSNAISDAEAIKKFLLSKNFKVIYAKNATQKQMRSKVSIFLDSLDKKSVGFVYFSGHGIQERSPKEKRVVNYLIPTDNKNLKSITDLDYNTISLNYILDSLREKDNGFNILLVDACRSPFKAFTRSSQGGLTPTVAQGTFIAYSTSAGERASDNGLFRKSFIKYASKPYKLVDVFEEVKQEVYRETGQIPYTSNGKLGKFYFTEPRELEPLKPIVQEVVSIPIPIMEPKREEKKIAEPIPVEKKYSLTISTTPSDAKVYLMGIKPRYRDGIELVKGNYRVKVIAEGYKKKVVTVSLEKDTKMKVALEKLPEIEKYSLAINTTPSNAKVYLKGIKAKYRDGIELPKGKYKVRVIADGYKKKLVTVVLKRDIDYDVVLAELPKIVKEPKPPKKQKVTSSRNSKWLTPSRSVCKSKGGEMFYGVCRANWSNAKKICDAMGGRLPSVEELRTEVTKCGGTIDDYNNNSKNSSYQYCYKNNGFSGSSGYWSSTTDASGTSTAWGVYFDNGRDYWYGKSNSTFVRCVRAGQ